MLWPNELYKKATEKSLVPELLETQENFIGILKAGADTVEDLFTIINHSTLPNNLFIRHLMVLCDMGGENLSSYNDALKKLLPSLTLEFFWDGKTHRYTFQRMGKMDRLSNAALDVTISKLKQKQSYRWPTEDNDRSKLQKDVIILLIFGSSSTDSDLAKKLQKCQIGEYLGQGKTHALDTFIRERYIWVSRQIGGAMSNTLGYLAEENIVNFLKSKLKEAGIQDIDIRQSSSIEGIYDNVAGNPVKFDVLATRANKHVAIEISFQETSNSVVERKRGQAQARYDMLDKSGNKLAYVIDGAGNFRRAQFVSMLCNYSHCTVTFSPSGFEDLYQFVLESLTS